MKQTTTATFNDKMLKRLIIPLLNLCKSPKKCKAHHLNNDMSCIFISNTILFQQIKCS